MWKLVEMMANILTDSSLVVELSPLQELAFVVKSVNACFGEFRGSLNFLFASRDAKPSYVKWNKNSEGCRIIVDEFQYI